MMSGSVQVPVTYITEPADGECGDCGFDALRRVRVYVLTEHGVTNIASRIYCGRCHAEERREREP